MVAGVSYDPHSFWAGVAVGRRLKGYAAYGTMPGYDPDGDLIVRPVIQGVPTVRFARDIPFTITSMVDSVAEDTIFPVHVPETLRQTVGTVVFARDTVAFTIVGMTETVASGELTDA